MSREMMMVRKRLYEASMGGNTTSLLELLEEDPLILERMITSFTETPLHIAAMFGHIDFANELLSHKPDLTSELDDSHGFSPLHLAALRKNIGMVKLLLEANPDVCSITDQEGRTPLHLAAMKGQIEAMKELISTCPGAIQVVSHLGRETILYLCVKHNCLEDLKLLLEELINNNNGGVLEDDSSSSISINSKDGYGNTILHLAVANKHWEMINFLLNKSNNSTAGIEVNALNKNGFTSLNVLIIQSARDLKDIEIGELLRGAGCIRASSLANNVSVSPSQGQQRISQTPNTNINHNNDEVQFAEWLKNTRTSLMVVASMIATMAFQAAGLSPPGGLWPAEAPASSLQVLFNTIGFLASLSIILLLISGLPLRRRFFVWILVVIMRIAITSMALSFSFTLRLTMFNFGTNVYTRYIIPYYVIIVWIGLVCPIVVLHFYRLMLRCCRKYKPMNYTRMRRMHD